MKIEHEMNTSSRACLLLVIMFLAVACAKNADQPTPSGNGPLIAGNETAAILQLRTIASAETAYMTTTGAGSYGTLRQLVDSQLIDSSLGSGDKSGYRFEVRLTPNSSYEAVARPAQYGITGLRSFYLNSNDGQIRGADKKGAEATASDPAS